MAGGRHTTEIEYATDIDFAKRGHSMRMGMLVEGGWFRSDNLTNYLGTFTFASLDDYSAGRPSNFTQRVGNPLVNYQNWQAGFYYQDDWRVKKNLTLSFGVREELQTHLPDHWNFEPRPDLTWSPFKNGKTTVSTGGACSTEWLDAETSTSRRCEWTARASRTSSSMNRVFPTRLPEARRRSPAHQQVHVR